MTVTDRLLLPQDVVLVPVAELHPELRARFEAKEGDYALSRLRSRSSSKIVDAQAAELLAEFRNPSTAVEAVINYCRSTAQDPEAVLDGAFELLQHLCNAQILVPAESAEASPVEPTFPDGAEVLGLRIIKCVHVLQDTELYKAVGPEGRQFALKYMRQAHSMGGAGSIRREAAILKHLGGTYAPLLEDAGELEGHDYIVMEWCSDSTAADVAATLRHSGSSNARQKMLQLCTDILDAYAALHARGVVHADVHPKNVLVADNGDVKIVDFGLARHEQAQNSSDEPYRGGVGFYYEPEYAAAVLERRRVPSANRLGEQYSLAALLYFLVVGKPYLQLSFEREEVFTRITREEPLPFVEQGQPAWPGVEAALRRALSKHPSGRYVSVAEFAAALKQELNLAKEGSDVSVSAPGVQVSGTIRDTLLRTVLERLGPSGTLVRTGLQTAPRCSVNLGAAGIAYMFYRISQVRDDSAALFAADMWLDRAARDLASDDAFHNLELEITEEKIGRVTPYHTASGVHLVRALVGHAMGEITTTSRAVKAFVRASQLPCDGLDLTLGKSSTLLGTTLLLETLSATELMDVSPLVSLGNATLQAIWNEVDRFGPVSESEEMSYLGMAHGWAGILYATLRWCQAAGTELPRSTEHRLQQVAELARPAGRGVWWSLHNAGGGRTPQGWPGWCHGTAGHLFLWTQAHAVFGSEGFLTVAERAGWYTWENATKNIGHLCCGLAGQAYALLNLHRHGCGEVWRDRAVELAESAARGAGASSMRPNSLYRGDVGVALLLAELEQGHTARMPVFESEGW